MKCLGVEPGRHDDPLSYGGTPVVNLLAQTMFGINQVFEWGKYKVNCTPNSHASQKQGYL